MVEQLSELILGQSFGKNFVEVAKLVQKQPGINFSELTRQSKLPFETLQNILITLYKQSLIKSRNPNIVPDSRNDEQSREFTYSLSIEDVIHRIRFPKIILQVSKVFGTICKKIIQEILENGCLNLTECMEIIINQQSEEDSDDLYGEKEIQNGFYALIRANYLQRMESSNFAFKEFDEEPSAKNDGLEANGKRRNPVAVSEYESKANKKVKKKAIQVNFLSKDGLSEKLTQQLTGTVPTNRSHSKDNDVDKDQLLIYDPETGQELLFRVNFRQFIHDFRTQMITELVLQKFNNRTGAWILKIIMSESKLTSRARDFQITESLSVSEISQKLGAIATMKESVIEQNLESLLKEGLVKKVVSNGNGAEEGDILPSVGYSAATDMLVSALKVKTIQKIIEIKFSALHSRVFGVLERTGYLDPKQVSDYCVLTLKEARSKLFDLYKAKFIDAQEIQYENEKLPGYIYGVKLGPIEASVTQDIYSTIYNLKAKQEMEMEALQPDVNLATDEQAKKKLSISKLESAILELDDDVLPFTEF